MRRLVMRADSALVAWSALTCFVTSAPGDGLSPETSCDGHCGLIGALPSYGFFGSSVCPLGDLNGDAVTDLAVGASLDDGGGDARGAVWILFLNGQGSVHQYQKISDTEGNFSGQLDDYDRFGASVSALSDFDGDAVTDLAVGAPWDGDGDHGRGAVWILFLNQDGTVKGHTKISDTEGSFSGELDDNDSFGTSVAALGDLDGDAVTDLAVGARGDDDGAGLPDNGAVWVLFLNDDGSVKGHQKISSTEGGLTFRVYGYFGTSVSALGDLDGDTVPDLSVGAPGDNSGGPSNGKVWILFLNSDGTVNDCQGISDLAGGFDGVLHDFDYFGTSLANLGDVDGDAVTDVAVGAAGDDDGGDSRGAVWILTLNQDGTVKFDKKISDSGFAWDPDIDLDDLDGFGASVTGVGDLDGDELSDLIVGANGDDDGGGNSGALWVTFLDLFGLGWVKAFQKISDPVGIEAAAEGEPCLADLAMDVTNGGCDAEPAVFGDGPCGAFICGTISTYDVDTTGDSIPDTDVRDTDWYLISPAELAAADVDGNGIVGVRSTLLSRFSGVTTFVTFDSDCDNRTILGSTGFSDQGCAAGHSAEAFPILPDHPNGLAVFVSTGHPGAIPIFDGFECSTGLNDYRLLIQCFDSPSGCDPMDPDVGPCDEPNPGVGGCSDFECCSLVCSLSEDGGFNPLCCLDQPLGWIQQCADAAIALCNLCPWDCDGLDDGIAGVTDLLALLGQFDTANPPCDGGGFCDFDGNGCVDVSDLLKLLAHYDPAGVGCP